MTQNATKFITPYTFQVLSKNSVRVGMFDDSTDWKIEHIEFADKADLFIIAPATANIIGKAACGIADDLLSTAIMATKAPVIFVPSMNVHMYDNPIVQENIKKLTRLGYNFLEPEEGALACGYEGKGRLPEIEVIFSKIKKVLKVK